MQTGISLPDAVTHSVCTSRFLTDANTVGVNKVAATDVPEAFLEEKYTELPPLEPYSPSPSSFSRRRPFCSLV